MKLKFHPSVYFVPLRPLSCVASDYSSGCIVWNGLLRPLRPLREIKIRTIVFHAKKTSAWWLYVSRKERKERKVLFPFVFHAGAGVVANFVTTRVRREFIHPLPPAGYSHLSQGESQLLQNITAPADCPPETGGTRSVATEGMDVFRLSVHHDHPAMLKMPLLTPVSPFVG